MKRVLYLRTMDGILDATSYVLKIYGVNTLGTPVNVGKLVADAKI